MENIPDDKKLLSLAEKRLAVSDQLEFEIKIQVR